MPAVPDLLGPDLDVLFCGINPGSVSGALGQHFARPGNRFWRVLHLAGFTDRQLRPDEQWALLDYKLGVTNLVARASASAAELSAAELEAGAAALAEKASRWRPKWVAVLGAEAYRKAFRRPKSPIGRQPEAIGPGSGLWVLPNPSGLQARYQIPDMVALYGELRRNL